MIFGSVINDNLKDEIIVTVIATGFTEEQLIAARPTRGSSFGTSNPARAQQSRDQPVERPREPRREEREQFQQPEAEPEPTRQQQNTQPDDGLDIPTFLRNRQRRK